MSSLISAIILSSLIVVAFKLFKRWSVDLRLAITINYLVAFLFGVGISGSSIRSFTADSNFILLSVLLGISFIVVFHLYARSAGSAGVAITAVSAKMSLMIPVLAGFVFFQETIDWIKVTGIVAALASFVLILWSPASKVKPAHAILPFLIFIGTGVNDSLLKLAQFSVLSDKDSIIPFLTLLFFISMLAGIASLPFKKLPHMRQRLWLSLVSGIVLGILNWGSTYYFLRGLDIFPVSIFLPGYNAGVVVLSSFVGLTFFHERLSVLNWTGIILATTAIAIMAMP